MKLVINLLLSALGFFIASYILPGVTVDSFMIALIGAVVLGLINMFIKPIIEILTLPINLLTLGLFSLVINAVLILVVDALVDGFEVDNLLWALVFSIVLSLINTVLGTLK